MVPAITAQMVPMMYCPSAPMLNRPTLNAKATAMPVSKSGVALMTTLEMYLGLPSIPLNRAANEARGS